MAAVHPFWLEYLFWIGAVPVLLLLGRLLLRPKA
jgi:hypothetical protein